MCTCVIHSVQQKCVLSLNSIVPPIFKISVIWGRINVSREQGEKDYQEYFYFNKSEINRSKPNTSREPRIAREMTPKEKEKINFVFLYFFLILVSVK